MEGHRQGKGGALHRDAQRTFSFAWYQECTCECERARLKIDRVLCEKWASNHLPKVFGDLGIWIIHLAKDCLRADAIKTSLVWL